MDGGDLWHQTGGGSWGWNASWPVCLLPNIEQNPLYNAYNHGMDPDHAPEIDASVYNAISTLLCPSDNQRTRPNYPWAPMNYHGNYGGPGPIRWLERHDRRRRSRAPPPIRSRSTAGALAPAGGVRTANLAYFGFEAITDGSSNTALFSEKLLGYAAGTTGNATPRIWLRQPERGIYISHHACSPGSGGC